MIAKGDNIVCAFADRGADPADLSVSLIVRDSAGQLRHEHLAPDRQSPDMRTLASVSEAAKKAMAAAVIRHLA